MALQGTDPYPSSTSDTENLIVLLLVLLGALLWTQVLASFCDIATSTRRRRARVKRQWCPLLPLRRP